MMQGKEFEKESFDMPRISLEMEPTEPGSAEELATAGKDAPVTV
jgi:hypothetical protein